MILRSWKSLCALALALTILAPSLAVAQVSTLGRRAVRAATSQLDREIAKLVRDGVRCVFHDEACIGDARASGKTPIMTDDDGNLITDEDGRPMTDAQAAADKAGPGQRPGTGAWVNYDFVPGDRVVFYDDYSDDTVGDFPRRFDLGMGNWEVVEWQGRRFLRATSNGAVGIVLPEDLPERFTIEFPASVQHGNATIQVSTAPILHGNREYAGSAPTLGYARAGLRPVKRQGPETMTDRQRDTRGTPMVTVRIMADGSYMKVYLDEHRVANAPNAIFPRTNTLFLSTTWARDSDPIMIGPLRVAAGGRNLYETLARDGRVATHGILFATNSDVIRPESTPTLKEIGEMLTAHADLRLSIEGHTDSDGDDAYNMDLSGRRAASVKSYLVQSFGIDAGRLETTGLGESTPVADNATPEGKQQNRRVELVRQGG
jgi:outer membrane protein OmpA-like peptidoglycan-associated protein